MFPQDKPFPQFDVSNHDEKGAMMRLVNFYQTLKAQKVFICLGLALLVAVLLPQGAYAQVLYGSIVGEVKDPTGAAIPGADVTVTNKETNHVYEGKTDQSGAYNYIDVQAGTYNLKVTHEGFKTFERTDIPVTINAVSRVDVALEVGSVSEAVTVTAEAPALQTDTPEVHSNIESTALENLPVPLGRNYQQIYRSLPGFSPPSNSHSIPTNPARSLAFNVNGTSNNQNNTRVDGVSTYNIQLPHVTSFVPTLESIEEVNVVTNSFDAEQGFAGGAAINVQTKSGTNALHGSLFEYNSNNHLKAWPEQFDNAGRNVGNKPKLVYNQYGGAVGGPIKKDKLFFFASYEGTGDHRSVQRVATVPTAAMRVGDFSKSKTPIYDPMTGDPVTAANRTQFVSLPADNPACTDPAGCPNIIPLNRLDPTALKIVALLPLPNRPGSNRNYFIGAPFKFDRSQLDSKFNFNATPRLSFIGTFGVLHYRTSVPTVFGDAAVGRPIGGSSNPGHGHGNTYRTTIMATYVFTPNFLMDAHFGYARQGTASEQPGLGTNVGSDTLGIPGTNGTRRLDSGWPEFDVSGFNTIGITNNFMPYFRQDPQYQYEANFNWIRGTHNIRFGSDLYRQALNHTQAEFISGAFGAQGGFDFNRAVTQSCLQVNPDLSCGTTSSDSRFNGIGSFLLGLPDFRSRTLQVPDVYHIHAWLMSVYLRDRWNVTPKLTLDYGLRWEYYPVPKRPDRGIERYDPDTNKVLLCGTGGVPSDCGVQISKKLFAPRLGFAYRANDSLVVRAGYGITIDPYEAMELLRANYPLLIALNQSSLLGGFFPVGRLNNSTPSFPQLSAGIPAIAVPTPSNGTLDLPSDVGFAGLPRKFNRGYVQSWNITVQKQLKWGFTGQAGYVATRSIRQLGFLDLNAGQVVGGGQAGEPLFAKFGRTATTVVLTPVATGHYDSLQASLQRRFAQGLQIAVNYTWGKAINQVDNSDAGPGGEKIAVYRYNYLNKSVTDFDTTHNLELTGVWQLPFGRGKHWLSGQGSAVSAIVSGWQINTLASLISGPPFSIYASGSGFNTPGSNQTADRVKPQVAKLGAIDPNRPFYDPFAFRDVNGARFGTSGFNILRAPGLVNWDFGLFREFSISERWKLQFRAEAFNFSNTPHFGTPDNCVCDANQLAADGTVLDPGPFLGISSVNDLAREGIDERQFRLGLRLSF